MEKTTIEDFKLPDGSVYSGECIKNIYMIELSGEGEIFYPNGDKYIGHFENGNVNGTGKYYFADGDEHHGEFYNGIPNGIGYLNKHESMCLGYYKNGKLNGWAIRLGDKFDFGWWKDGLLVKNETDIVDWAFVKIQNSSFDGSWVRFYKSGKFGFGIPPVKYVDYITPFFGFLFFKDGNITVGSHINQKKEGPVAILSADGNISYAEYQSDTLLKELTILEVRLAHLFGYPVD